MRRLKVLFVTEWYPTADRPAAAPFVREHARAVGLYHDVAVLHLAGRDPALQGPWRLEQETDPEVTQGIPTYRLWRQRLPLVPSAYPSQFWGAYRAGQALAAGGFRPDIVHAHVFAAGLPAALLGKVYGVPMVLTEHVTSFPRRTLTRPDLLVARLAFRLARRVLPVSRYLQGAIEAYGIRARFQVVPNVVDTALFVPDGQGRPAGGPRNILYVGTLPAGHHKGLPYLVQALAALPAGVPDWRLDVVGEGPGRGDVQQLVVDLGLGARVTFQGILDRAGVARAMRGCSFLVSPSLFETFGVVLIEALASGRPVIATRSGGPAEIVTSEVGCLVPAGDVQALAGVIVKMLEHCDDYDPARLSAYARQHYGYEAVGSLLSDVYFDVIGSGP